MMSLQTFSIMALKAVSQHRSVDILRILHQYKQERFGHFIANISCEKSVNSHLSMQICQYKGNISPILVFYKKYFLWMQNEPFLVFINQQNKYCLIRLGILFLA